MEPSEPVKLTDERSDEYSDEPSDEPIKFFGPTGDYGCFSNFSWHGFFLFGKWWPTSEHYYQAQKHIDRPLIVEAIRLSSSPAKAMRLANNMSEHIIPDWHSLKDDAMRIAVMQKFSRNPIIKRILLGTRDREIIENSPYDYYWGCGPDCTGDNMLGKILVETRTKLRRVPLVTGSDLKGGLDGS